MLALERDGFLGPQPLDHLERLVEDLQPRARARVRDAVGLILPLVPTGADAQDQPPAGEHVYARRFLREETGIAVRRARHELTQLDRRRVLRERG